MPIKKSKIDPRMFTTPLGALVGWALMRKMLPDATAGEQLVGAGLGGGIGYAGGSSLQNALQFADQGSAEANKTSYKDYLRSRLHDYDPNLQTPEQQNAVGRFLKSKQTRGFDFMRDQTKGARKSWGGALADYQAFMNMSGDSALSIGDKRKAFDNAMRARKFGEGQRPGLSSIPSSLMGAAGDAFDSMWKKGPE